MHETCKCKTPLFSRVSTIVGALEVLLISQTRTGGKNKRRYPKSPSKRQNA